MADDEKRLSGAGSQNHLRKILQEYGTEMYPPRTLSQVRFEALGVKAVSERDKQQLFRKLHTEAVEAQTAQHEPMSVLVKSTRFPILTVIDQRISHSHSSTVVALEDWRRYVMRKPSLASLTSGQIRS